MSSVPAGLFGAAWLRRARGASRGRSGAGLSGCDGCSAGGNAGTSGASERVSAAFRREIEISLQDGFRGGGVYLARAQRRERAFQLSRDRVGDEGARGGDRAGTGAADPGDAAVGGRSAEAVTYQGAIST